jgi:hypothetical protein
MLRKKMDCAPAIREDAQHKQVSDRGKKSGRYTSFNKRKRGEYYEEEPLELDVEMEDADAEDKKKTGGEEEVLYSFTVKRNKLMAQAYGRS